MPKSCGNRRGILEGVTTRMLLRRREEVSGREGGREKVSGREGGEGEWEGGRR